MSENTNLTLSKEDIKSLIYEIRGKKVMLDYDLAKIYSYETKRFNEQVKNNIELFNENEVFKLTKEELQDCSRSQIVTANLKIVTANDGSRSKKSTLNEGVNTTKRGSNIKYYPYAFTIEAIKVLPSILRGENVTEYTSIILDAFNDDIFSKSLDLVENKYDIVRFVSGDISLDVSVSPDEETVWLTQNDMAVLYDVDRSRITRHINNI